MNRHHRPLTAAVFLLLSLFEIYIGTGLAAEPTERFIDTLNPVRSQGISFDVATKHVDMRIALDRKSLEAGLVDVPFAARLVMTMIAKRMRCSDPVKQTSHLPILAGLHNQMSMIGHQREGKQLNRILL